ncbi:FecR family protein [Erythrobacter sp. W302b]|uniref:FecR family protein n=1 Tax=Erythrobacter sp. W302b TaxID=3389874 RepID=UPI00396B47AF
MQPTENEQDSDLDSEAAAWAARLDARPGEAMPELEAWLARDPRRTGALLRAQAILAALAGEAEDAERAVQPGSDSMAPPAMHGIAGRRWRAAVVGGLTAIAAAVALFLIWPGTMQVYETETGEIKQIALADGSAMAIDARSRLEVAFDSNVRLIRLNNGRAIFRATKGDRRPFVVKVGTVTITDIGTEFQVLDDPLSDTIEVLVTEGVVEVDNGAQRMNIVAGQRLRVGRSTQQTARLSPEVLASRDIVRMIAWREGRLELDGETLAETVVHLNRTNRVQIRIADPSLGKKALFGTFLASDPRGFAEAVAVSLDTRMSEKDGVIVLGS